LEAATSFETAMNVFQIIRRHIPAGCEFETAGRRSKIGRYIAGDLGEVECEGREGIEVAQVREEW
jgi:hypothetical protein